ncbi:MAG: hypothetical protein Alpg2KO_24660 [Alphaproteobacteria bacterium]
MTDKNPDKTGKTPPKLSERLGGLLPGQDDSVDSSAKKIRSFGVTRRAIARGVMTWPDGAAVALPQGAGTVEHPVPGTITDGIKKEETTDSGKPKQDGGKGGPGGTKYSDDPTLQRCAEILAEVPEGKAILDHALAAGIAIKSDNRANVYGYYSPEDKIVAINPRGEPGQLIATLAHELRHVWQDSNGYLERLKRSPYDVIALTRMVEADAEAFSVQCAYRLARKGRPEVLSAHRKTQYGDETLAYLHAVKQDPKAADNGKAMRAVFDQWFSRDWRRNAYDRGTTDWLEFVLFEYRTQAAKGFDKLSDKKLHPLGAVPGAPGMNYLKGTGNGRSLTDAYYTGGVLPELKNRLDQIAAYFNKPPAPKTDRRRLLATRPVMSRGQKAMMMVQRARAGVGKSPTRSFQPAVAKPKVPTL